MAVGTHSIAGASLTTTPGATVKVTDATYMVTNIDDHIDRASIRFYSPDYATYIEYAAQDIVPPTFQVPAFEVGPEITSTPGVWHVYAVVQKRGEGTARISATSVPFTVSGTASPTPAPTGSAPPTPTDVPVGCVGQDRGNFGELDSPRRDTSQTQIKLAENLALGLDHVLVPYPFPEGESPTKDCGTPQRPGLDRAAFDNQPVDGRNCIAGDSGNDGPGIYDGLIEGVPGSRGRLDAAVSGRSTSALCQADGRSNSTVGDRSINNDVLSCYLRNGASLNSIAQLNGVDPTILDPSVVDSPRFVWIPVVVATDRAQKDYQPIYDFAPAFITDETQTSAATPSNGLDINGNSVKTLQIFVFNKAALPFDERSPTVDFDEGLNAPAVRLVR